MSKKKKKNNPYIENYFRVKISSVWKKQQQHFGFILLLVQLLYLIIDYS